MRFSTPEDHHPQWETADAGDTRHLTSSTTLTEMLAAQEQIRQGTAPGCCSAGCGEPAWDYSAKYREFYCSKRCRDIETAYHEQIHPMTTNTYEEGNRT